MPKERAQASMQRYPTRLTGTIVANSQCIQGHGCMGVFVRIDPDDDLAAWCVVLQFGPPVAGVGTGAREGGQDCDGISPSSSYQVTHPTTGGSCPRGRKINAR